jgi:cytochrome c oxidase assembly protein subunit 15
VRRSKFSFFVRVCRDSERRLFLNPISPRKPQAVRGNGITLYNAAHHWFAIFTACATFLLIVAGALVTSNDAGLSVPDWPTSFGHIAKMPPMVGGVKFEHSHRMIAEFIGVLTIAIAVWTWRADRRRWMKMLGLAALGTVIAQGILGGITVLKFLPPAVSTAHAVVGQTFFCIAVCIAMFTGRRWVGEEPKSAAESQRPTLQTLSLLSICALYLQLVLGGMFRHKGMSWEPHVINAAIVTFLLTWTVVRALSRFSEVKAVRTPAILLISLLMVQLSLGFFAFIEKVVLGANAVQPTSAMVLATVTHTAIGALLLATAVVLAIQTWRHVPVLHRERVSAGSRKAVTA